MRAFSTILVLTLFASALIGCAKTEDAGPTTPSSTTEKPADDKAAAGDITSDLGGAPTSPETKFESDPVITEKPVTSGQVAEPPEKAADDANRPIPALKDSSGKTVRPRDES